MVQLKLFRSWHWLFELKSHKFMQKYALQWWWVIYVINIEVAYVNNELNDLERPFSQKKAISGSKVFEINPNCRITIFTPKWVFSWIFLPKMIFQNTVMAQGLGGSTKKRKILFCFFFCGVLRPSGRGAAFNWEDADFIERDQPNLFLSKGNVSWQAKLLS